MKVLKVFSSISFICIFFLPFTVDSQSQQLHLRKITDHLYMISDETGGGNVAFLVTEEGILVVDAKLFLHQGKEVVAKIREVSDKPIKYLVYTHHHEDHTHGAQALPSNITIISHINTYKNMKNIDMPRMEITKAERYPQWIENQEKKIEKLKAKKSSGLEKAIRELEQAQKQFEEYKKIKLVFPNLTFEKKSVIYLSDQKVELLHMGKGHTDGDVIVYFPHEKVVHM